MIRWRRADSEYLNRFRGFRKFNGFRGPVQGGSRRFSGFKRFGGASIAEARGIECALRARMAAARTHEDLIAWQRAYELKLGVYALLKRLPPSRDPDYWDQLRRSARSAPRLIAEGFGRYLPADFSKYLRYANGELKETYDALRDGVDAGDFTDDEILPSQRSRLNLLVLNSGRQG